MPHSRISLIQTFLENTQNAYSVAFSSSGKNFAAAGGLRSVFMYDVDKPEAIGGLADHRQSIYAMHFSKSGKYFFTTGRDGMVKVYDAQSFDKIATILAPQIGAKFIATSISHQTSQEGRTFISDGETNIEIKDTSGIYQAVSYIFYELEKTESQTAKAGRLIQSVLEQEGMAVLSQEVIFSNPQLLPNYAIATNQDETLLYIGASGGALKVFRTSDWSLVKVCKIHSGNIRTIAISPDGKLLSTGSSDRLVKVLNANTLEVSQTIEGHGDSIFSVVFSSDGNTVATGGKDARLRIWGVEGEKFIPKVKVLAHTFSIKAMTFLNQGRELITVSQDKTIKLWDIEKTQCLETIDRTMGGHTFTINTISVAKNEKHFVTGSDDKTVKLWQIKD